MRGLDNPSFNSTPFNRQRTAIASPSPLSVDFANRDLLLFNKPDTPTGLDFFSSQTTFSAAASQSTSPAQIQVIQHATHNMLIQNQVYQNLLFKNVGLEAEIKGIRSSFEVLTQQVTATAHPSERSNRLEAEYPELSGEDYPLVTIWTLQESKKAVKKNNDVGIHQLAGPQRGKNKDLSAVRESMSYIQDVNGTPITEGRAKEICTHARRVWQYLLQNQFAPETWGAVTPFAREYYTNEMYKNFKELRYCGSPQHWKVERLATDTYPGWIKSTRKRKEPPTASTSVKLEKQLKVEVAAEASMVSSPIIIVDLAEEPPTISATENLTDDAIITDVVDAVPNLSATSTTAATGPTTISAIATPAEGILTQTEVTSIDEEDVSEAVHDPTSNLPLTTTTTMTTTVAITADIVAAIGDNVKVSCDVPDTPAEQHTGPGKHAEETHMASTLSGGSAMGSGGLGVLDGPAFMKPKVTLILKDPLTYTAPASDDVSRIKRLNLTKPANDATSSSDTSAATSTSTAACTSMSADTLANTSTPPGGPLFKAAASNAEWNLFGREYLKTHKRPTKQEVKDAYEALSPEEKEHWTNLRKENLKKNKDMRTAAAAGQA